jgi:hypothetical protein
MTRRKREMVGLANERDFPHVVERTFPPGGFRSVFLEIDAFHRERRIPVRRGRGRTARCGAANNVLGTAGGDEVLICSCRLLSSILAPRYRAEAKAFAEQLAPVIRDFQRRGYSMRVGRNSRNVF